MGEGGRLEKPSTFKYFTASKRHSPKREGWLCAPVAQLVEQKTLNLRVGGSIPSRRKFNRERLRRSRVKFASS